MCIRDRLRLVIFGTTVSTRRLTAGPVFYSVARRPAPLKTHCTSDYVSRMTSPAASFPLPTRLPRRSNRTFIHKNLRVAGCDPTSPLLLLRPTASHQRLHSLAFLPRPLDDTSHSASQTTLPVLPSFAELTLRAIDCYKSTIACVRAPHAATSNTWAVGAVDTSRIRHSRLTWTLPWR